ncbi:hypothetical protein LZL87_011431 [Fusarium oxysporum]|nr:hypothetical protein LZL87_011431 [Fusarium oxysporum]
MEPEIFTGSAFESHRSGNTILLRPGTAEAHEELPTHFRDSAQKNVKIPCPCSAGQALQCICPKCKNTVFFVADGNYLHCTCGGYKLADAVFKCFDQDHGNDYLKYQDTEVLASLLHDLNECNQYNILILGPLDIDKSTFINSLINYLLFESLQDALEAPCFHWAVPSSFNFPAMVNQKWEKIEVQIGQSHSHLDKFPVDGSSSPQTYMAHVLNIHGVTIRLIDTPGFGDARGPENDKEHMKHFNRIFKSIDTISTILILSTPNTYRLTPYFDYYMTALLSLLHKETKPNIAFGFVDARLTNFSLDPSLLPLQALLDREKTEIKLGYGNTYFFDSAGFRYLATYKVKGQNMRDEVSSSEIFKHSAQESRRLVKSTIGRNPHELKKTWGLGRARSYIKQVMQAVNRLDIPLEVTQKRSEAEEARFQELRMEQMVLQRQLEVQVVRPVKRDYLSPRLVCGHVECTKYGSSEGGVQVTEHKTCHNNCFEINSASGFDDTFGTPDLSVCEVFRNPGGLCRNCGHGVGHHVHKTYELVFERGRIENPGLTEQYRRNASSRAGVEKTIQLLQDQLTELKDCEAIVNKVLASLMAYLRANALVEYNRTVTSYFNYLVAEARKNGNREVSDRLHDQYLNYRHDFDQIVRAENELKLPGYVPTDLDINDLLKRHGNITAAGYDIIDLSVIKEDY